MGKASRRKAELREKMSPDARRLLKKMIKESKPDQFVIRDETKEKGVLVEKTKSVYMNPMKKLLKKETYLSDDGRAATQEVVKKYNQYLKTRLNVENIAKKTGIDPDGVIEGDDNNE